jgi:hypothetical protein
VKPVKANHSRAHWLQCPAGRGAQRAASDTRYDVAVFAVTSGKARRCAWAA